MRVLMVSDVYFPRVNGVSTSIETFRHALAEYGVHIRVVAPRYRDEPDTERILRVPGRAVPRDPEDRLVRWRAMHDVVGRASEDADLIHIQTPFIAHYVGEWVARTAGIPVIATYHTLFEEYLHHYAPFVPAAWLRAMARRFSRAQCNALDAVIVPSRAMAQRLASYGVTAPVHILPTGIPLQQFEVGDGARFRASHGIAANRPVALFVGRVAHEKNIGFLFDALRHARRHLPDLLLLIAGEGPARGDLQRRADTAELRGAVRFLGYLDRRRGLPDCYAAADAFVFASRTETQGLVLLEAMALGTPVIALSVMGTTDILAPGRGCRTPADDPKDFAAAMVDVLGNPQLRAQLSLQAREYAHEWSDRTMAQRLARLYRQLTASSPQWKAPTKERPV